MIAAVDLFCGAGGTSSGIIKAVVERLQKRINLVAVNHWQTAINTHQLNYPFVTHLCQNVENIHPRDVIKSGRLDLLAASCECTFHSNARGGGPCNEQSRSQAWQLIRWATDIQVDNILMENVREFMNWGPLLSKPTRYRGRYYKKDRPDPRRKGEFFRAFVNTLSGLGYTVEHRIQCAADFGDPTTRQRLILQARKGNPVLWPDPTHGRGRAYPWRSARECIDWSLKGKTIFRPDGTPRHCCNTVQRIIAGLRRFGGPAAEPFIVMLNGTTQGHIEASAHSLSEPFPTVVAGGNHALLCEPFFVQTDHTGGNGAYVRQLDKPLPTVVTKQNLMLVEPMLMKYYRTGICKPVDVPFDTVTTKPRFLLVECDGSRQRMDILTRLVQPHELAASHSFPSTYQFTGSKEDQTMQIGNSVPVELAAAHAHAILS